MFDATVVERTFTREQWTKLYRIMRKIGDRGALKDESWLANRAQIKGIIDKYVDDAGQVGVVESGRDCDCVEYCHGSTKTNLTPPQFCKMRDDMYEWAEGPCYLSICSVRDLPDNYQRDLAMEAFENGHPHFITGATI